MFFRRLTPKVITFEDRLEGLRKSGFVLQPLDRGRVQARKGNCAAILDRSAEGEPRVVSLGVLVGGEISSLIDGGYQKFLETPSGMRLPALAPELKTLHDFQEDLDEALGLETLYNLSLGTVCNRHAYDRLKGRPSS
jgi:hypothetical protein